MKLAGVEAKQRKKFKATTDSKHTMPVAPNLLERQFAVKRRELVWVGDITLWTQRVGCTLQSLLICILVE